MGLFGIRTTIGQEKIVVDNLKYKREKEGEEIASISFIDTLRGYVLIEADNEGEVRKLIYKAPHIRGMVKGEMNYEEIKHFLETKPLTSGIERGDIVEVTSGAFKGEKAKVIRIDEAKDKITVEIIESAVPIPVTIDASSIRIMADLNKDKK